MAQKFDEIKHSLNDSLHDDTKPWKGPLDLIEQKSGVPRVYIVIVHFLHLVHASNRKQWIDRHLQSDHFTPIPKTPPQYRQIVR